ncbi:ABC transporter permease [Cellulomonas soli]|uniref:Transport permease protein n=1 Tax=Cellulomonas soli TaxID=931535 RepID=A0A512PI98_9CELL|nr:ABC transporter permease [Cellulomonas soli]NYI58683.1 lipooligosaccharide transport system permease protein [Cellulomonas soli]GEP70934.1 transport permease protein [Cellulomonas soli]
MSATTSTDLFTDEAMVAAARPRRLGAFYVAEHRLRAMRAYGWTLVIGSVGNPLLYLLGIGLGLAAFIDQPVAQGPHGPVDYVQFVAPALLATAAVSVATEEFTYAVMEGFKWRRLFWGMNASPVSPAQIAAGQVLAVGARMLFTTAVYALLAFLLGGVDDPWAAAALPFVGLLAGLAFGLPLMAYAASLKDDSGQFAMVQRFVFTPMFLFSGTFYPITTLPAWLQWIGWVSPLWHASELGRAITYGTTAPGWQVAVHVVVLIGMAAGGWLLARQAFVRRLR